MHFSQGVQTYAGQLSKLYQGGVVRHQPGRYLYVLGQAANRAVRLPLMVVSRARRVFRRGAECSEVRSDSGAVPQR